MHFNSINRVLYKTLGALLYFFLFPLIWFSIFLYKSFYWFYASKGKSAFAKIIQMYTHIYMIPQSHTNTYIICIWKHLIVYDLIYWKQNSPVNS